MPQTSDEDLFEAVETERTCLRCVRRDDAGTVARLMTPAISRWLASWPTTVTEQWVEAKILEAREEIAAGRALHFLVERKTEREVMGWIRVSRVHPNSQQGDLSYWIGEAYQGQGYTTEAAFKSVAVAFELLRLDSIEAGAQPENVASFKVMRRLGMEPSGERVVWASARNRHELCIFYSVTRDKFAIKSRVRESDIIDGCVDEFG